MDRTTLEAWVSLGAQKSRRHQHLGTGMQSQQKQPRWNGQRERGHRSPGAENFKNFK